MRAGDRAQRVCESWEARGGVGQGMEGEKRRVKNIRVADKEQKNKSFCILYFPAVQKAVMQLPLEIPKCIGEL